MSPEMQAIVKSWAKVFLAAALASALVLLQTWIPPVWAVPIIAGVFALGPVVLNYLNESDTRYGKGYVPPVDE
jgi:hypothetical protein